MGAGEVVAMGGETRLVESNAQLGFGFAPPASTGEVEPAPREERFLSGAEGDFFVGEQGLAEYLDAHQQGWVVKLKVLVSELDYSPFYGRYKDEGGRRPIHPRVMLELIVYGITQGKWSLRELERLARMDLGALWMSGRVQPDHSTIGKFIQLHAELLSEQFFTTLVKQLVSKLHLSAGTVGLDGTVIAAAASQHRAVFAVEPRRLLGYAGYHTLDVLSEFAAREIDVLIPAGRTYAQPPWEKRQAQRKLPKSAFRYEAEADVYHCPGQRLLARAGGDRDRHGRRYMRYRGDCRGCVLRDQCTKSKTSRTLKRYAGEEIKEALAAVLQQPAALRQLRRRGAIIEPLWADLRERQRLTRFHRRGLAKVKLEFALHCAAYNLRKVAVGAGLALLFTLSIRSASRRQLVAIGWIILPSPL